MTAKEKNDPAWTVMVYMVAGDDAELDGYAVSDLQEMQQAKFGTDVQVLVQIQRHWPDLPQRYVIAPNCATLVQSTVGGKPPAADAVLDEKARATAALEAKKADMGTKEALTDFLAWARTQARPGKDEKYCLVLWGHNYGLGFGRDHNDPLRLEELEKGLASLRDAREGKPPLELLGANACAMSYAEAAFQLRDVVKHMVASQIAVPFAGWPYTAILGSLKGDTTSEQFGRLVISRYADHFRTSPAGHQVSMTLLDLEQAEQLRELLDALSDAMIAALDTQNPTATDRLRHIRAAFLSTAAGDERPLIDARDLCAKIVALCEDLEKIEGSIDADHDTADFRSPLATGAWTALKKAAGNLQVVLDRRGPRAGETMGASVKWPRQVAADGPNPEENAPPLMTPPAPLIVDYVKHAELAGLNGLGIYAPFVTDDSDLKRLGLDDDAKKGRDTYQELALVKDTDWPSLVYDRLRVALPDEVLAGVEGSGATSREERAVAAQMLASIDSVFDTLDRRIAATLQRLDPDGASGAGSDKAAGLGRFSMLKLIDSGNSSANGSEPGGASLSQRPPTVVQDPSTSVRAAVDALVGLESMLAEVERVVRRTVTNGTFGLGPGTLRTGLNKRDLGALNKRDLGALNKRDLGALNKRDLGGFNKRDLGGLNKRDLGVGVGYDSSPAAVMQQLFLEVGLALKDLEAATGEVERAVAAAVGNSVTVDGFTPKEAREQLDEQVEIAFDGLAESSIDARRTLRRVLADPLYGFGPGPKGIGVEDRRELARASGLRYPELRLLT